MFAEGGGGFVKRPISGQKVFHGLIFAVQAALLACRHLRKFICAACLRVFSCALKLCEFYLMSCVDLPNATIW